MSRIFVGIDWATEKHDVCILSSQGEVLGERVFRNTVAGLEGLGDWIAEVGGEAKPSVAIETPRGSVVSALLERELSVFAINPKQLDRFRDRFFASGAKDDRRDARVLADSLRTDQRAYRRVSLEAADIVELRAWVQIDDDLKREKVRLTNRLRAQLRSFFPQVLEIEGDLARVWILDLLKEIPTPEIARRKRASTVSRILRKHKIRKVDAKSVLKTLREPSFVMVPGAVEAAQTHIRLASERLRLVLKQLHECTTRIDAILDRLANSEEQEGEGEGPVALSDTAILLSLPGAGRTVVSTLLAYAADALQARDYQVLRGLCGVAPITRRSGKRIQVSMRRACSPQLRKASHYWAGGAAIHDPHWKARYKALRARGRSHGAACRSIGDRLLAVAVAMLRDGTVYDPTKRRASVQSVAA